MARHHDRHHAAGPQPSSLAEAVRDRLTRECLAVAALAAGRRRGHEAEIHILDFDPSWWDGQTHEPCLVVEIDGARARVVETAGQPVVLPFSRRAAGRALAERRRVRPAELTLPEPRSARYVSLDAIDDVLSCGTPACGALRPVGASECPRCGLPQQQRISLLPGALNPVLDR